MPTDAMTIQPRLRALFAAWCIEQADEQLDRLLNEPHGQSDMALAETLEMVSLHCRRLEHKAMRTANNVVAPSKPLAETLESLAGSW